MQAFGGLIPPLKSAKLGAKPQETAKNYSQFLLAGLAQMPTKAWPMQTGAERV